ncbi:kinase-like domain-containing protein [Gigaspora rosea]|uniref:Kinase-like domain-containing protein n=1 Tax=Gigaspora rosea TaxID=44941 RepID=A0A397VZY6_9GLOM|nr:kinase-like domain-containing protein [Gigaspora rosea]
MMKRKEGSYKISWKDLTKIATEITDGLKHLHDNKIIHRNLHPNNVLIDNGKALITDFGVSRQLDCDTTASSAIDMPVAYIDPQYLQYSSLSEKSDIYSLGVLFWELTSGIPPFKNSSTLTIMLEVLRNNREKPVANTPKEYIDLYKECWSPKPAQRPTLNYIKNELKRLSKKIPIKYIKNNIVYPYHLSNSNLGSGKHNGNSELIFLIF